MHTAVWIRRLQLFRRPERTDYLNGKFPSTEFPSPNLCRGSDTERGQGLWRAAAARKDLGKPQSAGLSTAWEAPCHTWEFQLPSWEGNFSSRDLHLSQHCPQWLWGTRSPFPRLWKTGKDQPPPAWGQGNKAAPQASLRAAERGAKKYLESFLRGSVSARDPPRARGGGAHGLSALAPPRPMGVAAGCVGEGSSGRAASALPGGGARALSRPRVLPSPPLPHAFFHRPRSRKGSGRGEGKCCSVERGGRRGRKKEKGNRNMAVSCRGSSAARSS